MGPTSLDLFSILLSSAPAPVEPPEWRSQPYSIYTVRWTIRKLCFCDGLALTRHFEYWRFQYLDYVMFPASPLSADISFRHRTLCQWGGAEPRKNRPLAWGWISFPRWLTYSRLPSLQPWVNQWAEGLILWARWWWAEVQLLHLFSTDSNKIYDLCSHPFLRLAFKDDWFDLFGSFNNWFWSLEGSECGISSK